jgi:ABC-type glycerol-3-phosphate transport system substrate-binding protein
MKKYGMFGAAVLALLVSCAREQKAVPEDVLSGEINGTITVSCYETMTYRAFLEGAARLFEAKYPGTTVNIKTFSAMPDVKTSEQGGGTLSLVQIQNDPAGRMDYINRVNTSLMSGSGADILAMDVLPFYKYARNGSLENLDAFMDADSGFDKSVYQANVLDAARYHDGLWFLPIDYTFDYYAYDATLLAPDAAEFGVNQAFTVEELMALGMTEFDGSARLFNSYDFTQGGGSMFDLLLNENSSRFVDLETRTASFADGEFARLLQTVKDYAASDYIPAGARSQGTDRYFFKLKNNFAVLQQLASASGRRMMVRTGANAGGIETDDQIAGIAARAEGAVPFGYTQGYGINAQSKNKRTAWEFLKFLLSEEMQISTSIMVNSLPLHNNARAKKAELALSGALMGRQQALSEADTEILRQYNQAIETLSASINSMAIEDTVITDMIMQEAAAFFNGTRTAGECARALQNKAELYLNE